MPRPNPRVGTPPERAREPAHGPVPVASADAAELAGSLLRDVAVLVEREAALAVSRHLEQLQRSRSDLLRLAGAALALGFAVAALVWAGVRGLDTILPGWAAALTLALALLIAAALLLPRRTLAALRRLPHESGSASGYRQARDEAEQRVRSTGEALARALAHALVQHEETVLLATAEREVGDVEHTFHTIESTIERSGLEREAESALGELTEILALPVRASIDALRRILGDPERGDERPRPGS